MFETHEWRGGIVAYEWLVTDRGCSEIQREVDDEEVVNVSSVRQAGVQG